MGASRICRENKQQKYNNVHEERNLCLNNSFTKPNLLRTFLHAIATVRLRTALHCIYMCIYAYTFYLIYFILLIFLICLRTHKTYILLNIHECLPLLYCQVFMCNNSLVLFGDIYNCIITLQKFQISQLLAVITVLVNILVISLMMAYSSRNMQPTSHRVVCCV